VITVGKIRRSQVEKIKKARIAFIRANDDPKATKTDRARANAVLDRLLVNSSECEHRQAYRESPYS
jgi:hypothetical protein